MSVCTRYGKVLTPVEARRVILAAKPGLPQLIIQTEPYAGARISEMLALRWPDMDFDESVIHLAEAIDSKGEGRRGQEKVRWFDPKTKSGLRDVRIPVYLVTEFRDGREVSVKQARFGIL
jgi:integrase